MAALTTGSSQTLEVALSTLDTSAFRMLSRSITSSNRQLIIQKLHDAEDNLNECESEIAILLARRERHIRSIQRCQALLTPIHNLPTEILSSIFDILCEENAFAPDSAPLPLTLSAVSSRWRQIVVSSPALWSSLEVNASLWEDESMLARTVQTFMDRSHTKPLKIRLQCNNYHRERAVVDPSLRILATHSSRWLVMNFSFDTSSALDWDITEGIRRNLPLLRHVDFDFDPLDLFEGAPALRSASCRCVHEVPGLPFEQLTRLTVAFTLESVAGRMLQRCRALKQLELIHVREQDDIGDMVIVPNVEELTLTMSTELTIRFVLARWRFPQLHSLKLAGVPDHLELGLDGSLRWSSWDDVSFFQQSSRITTLRLEALPVEDSQTLDILASLPLLQQLFVSDLGTCDLKGVQTITSMFLEGLAFREGRPAVVPQLRVLALDVQFAGFDAAGLVSMVYSRWNIQNGSFTGGVCLQSVDVSLSAESLPHEFLELDPLKVAGLQISVSLVKL